MAEPQPGGTSADRANDVDAVRIDGVSHTYPGGLRALDGIDLRVRAGEFVSLIGPSGCGKSTLLRIVAGLVPPSSGRAQRAANIIDRTAFVFQSPTLMPWASVRRNARLPLDLAGVPRVEADARASRALAQMGLADFAEAYPRTLSGGMQMRVSIARALVIEPELLLMDEPFGALDEITRVRLDQDLLDLAASRRLTVLFVTHSVQEAAFLSSRVVVMHPRPGRIAEQIRIDEPHPRGDAFRHSERFAALSARLSRALAVAGLPP